MVLRFILQTHPDIIASFTVLRVTVIGGGNAPRFLAKFQHSCRDAMKDRNTTILGTDSFFSMSPEEQNQLIFDTLHYRPPAGQHFVVNEPGLKLIAGDASLLSSVKAALMGAAHDANWGQLYGLDYVIGAFLILGTKHAPDTLVPFITSLPPQFRKEVVAVIPVFFQKREKTDTYNFSERPPRELVQFVRQLSSSEDSELQKEAQRVLKVI